MGEWSDYFEDFPEENPANYVGNRFDPKGAEALRAAEAKATAEQAKLNAEIARIVKKHSKPDSSGAGGK
ncbi:MAG TPA: hypothetical protein VGE50_05825 [Gammaproteobacteria bacterium]